MAAKKRIGKEGLPVESIMVEWLSVCVEVLYKPDNPVPGKRSFENGVWTFLQMKIGSPPRPIFRYVVSPANCYRFQVNVEVYYKGSLSGKKAWQEYSGFNQLGGQVKYLLGQEVRSVIHLKEKKEPKKK